MYKHIDHHYHYHLLSKQCFIFHQYINFHDTLEEPNHINYDDSHKTVIISKVSGFLHF